MRHLLLLAVATTAFAQDPVPAPEGAVLLFDGKSTDQWIHRNGASSCKWKLVDGALEVVPGTSDLLSKKHFADHHLHVEFWLPKPPDGARGQGRSNSGVYVQGRYEVQVLDSYGKKTLAPGDCGGIYGQKPADRNAARPTETWQTYDIHFTAPRFEDGKRVAKPRITVFWNGVRIHDDVEIDKPTTANAGGDPTTPGPVLLQDHGNPVRYRNVWVVEKSSSRGTAETRIATPRLFADHMVLQRETKTPIWGTAAANADVEIVCGTVSARGKADANGRFQIALPPQPVGGPHELVITCHDAKHVIRDVLIGEVWICSGQSNMRWRVRQSMNAEQEIADAHHPRIRLASVKETTADVPATDAPIVWARCSPETIGDFSAVAYYFGRHLQRELGTEVPIGLIMTSWGGTPIEAWTSAEALAGDPVIERWRFIQARNAARWKTQLERWNARAEVAAADGKPAPKKPRRPRARAHHRPGSLFNGMIAPLIPFSIRGAIWYQGESNASRAWQYRRLFKIMINDWRKRFGREFPFLFVELANFRKTQPDPVDSEWAELREAQRMAMELPRVGMACAIDIGAAGDIHPRNKQEVGRRLALVALKDTYGKNVICCGPTPRSVVFENGVGRITFANAAGLKTRDGGPVKGFAVAGKDKKWHWAEATIDGDSVVLTCDAVDKPVAARYAWADNPVCNLVNGAGLPAPSFRTDLWKGITDGKER